MKIYWKKLFELSGLLLAGTGAVIVAICSASKNSNSLESWLGTASDDDLSDNYEERRQQWLKDGCGGNGEKTAEMKKIDSEMSRRAAEKWEKNPCRNTDPNFRWTDANRWDKD